MGIYNGKLSENALSYGQQWFVRKNTKNLIEICDRFTTDKVCLGFRTYDKNGEAGSKIQNKIDFYLDIPSFELLVHNILSGNFASRVQKEQYEPIYRGSPRDGKVYSRVLQFSKAERGFFITAHEGDGKQTQNGAVTPSYKLTDNDHSKVSIMLTSEELKMFALQGKRALDFYYLHYFGRE